MSALYANSPLLFPHSIWKQVQSGEIKFSFEYCEFLKANRPKGVKPADVRGLLNMGGEL
jgi:hypothetical protein